MTQDERWKTKYDEVVEFINTSHRNPSRHRIEDYNMLNWVKANRKKMNAGALEGPGQSKFMELLALVEDNKRVNQYV